MAVISAKYLYAMVISLLITILSFEIGVTPKKVDNFKQTMDMLRSQSHVSLELAKMRVDTAVAHIIRSNNLKK